MALPAHAISQLPVRSMAYISSGIAMLTPFPSQALPSLGSDLWPSLSGVVAHPLKTLRRYRLSKSRTGAGVSTQLDNGSLQSRSEVKVRLMSLSLQELSADKTKASPQTHLPECLSKVPLDALRTISNPTPFYSSSPRVRSACLSFDSAQRQGQSRS